mmetsp:Transcript_5662/g.14530  ORF Transcript_5662/g.14530 Transcript_5662/m.14530 type:complete len:468 (-) Transcript_5662:261-1664(-)
MASTDTPLLAEESLASLGGSKAASKRLSIVFGSVQVAIAVAYGMTVRYSEDMFRTPTGDGQMGLYPMFADVGVMVFLGFGLLMTFLRKYMYSAVCLTMLTAALCIECHVLVGGFIGQLFDLVRNGAGLHPIDLDLVSLVSGNFAAASVLITFGAVIGKVSPMQLLTLAMLELPFYSLNENIGLYLQAADVGGSMTIHAFGAYFGLAATWVLTPRSAHSCKDCACSYQSDMFSIVGTLFLWLFWPSFNGVLAGAAQQRAVCSTVLSLVGSAVGGFLASQTLRDGRFHMEDLQNATLAGGVAIGSAANFALPPCVAMLVGLSAGCLSVVGYAKIQSALFRSLAVHDTCGVHNLHGMPGVLGGVVSAIFALWSTAESYHCSNGDITAPGCQVGLVFPGRVNPTFLLSPVHQACFQMVYLACTLAIAILSGLLVGSVVKTVEPKTAGFFTDSVYFEVPEDETGDSTEPSEP